MIAAPLSTWQAMWALTRLRLVRLSNQVLSASKMSFGAKKSRNATGGKNRGRGVITLVVMLLMLFSFSTLARNAVLNLHGLLDPVRFSVHLCDKGEKNCETVTQDMPRANERVHHLLDEIYSQSIAQRSYSPALKRALALEVTFLFLLAVLAPLGAREMAQGDWDLEWLVTLPVSRASLLWSRLAERTVTNLVGTVGLLPITGMIAWYAGYRWSAPLLALLATAVLLALAALARTLVDTGLRLSLAPPALRNLQAMVSLATMLPMYAAMSFGLPMQIAAMRDVARAAPGWLLWTPPGLVVQALNARDLAGASGPVALLLAQTAVIMWLGVRLLQYQLRKGVVADGERESGRQVARPAAAKPAAASAGASRGPRWLVGSPVQRRELRLLSRDRNFLVQAVLLPVVMVLTQLWVNGKLDHVEELGRSPVSMAAIAFGISAYMLMTSAFQTLNTEGGALWLLYTMPHRLDQVLKDKARLWSAIALVYPLAVFGLGIYFSHGVTPELVGLIAVVLIGVPIYSAIAVSLGVFGCDPLAQEVQSRVRPTYLYLYMMLASLYTYAIFVNNWPNRLVLMVLTGSLAMALWQKARDELPYLLDPVASPPARVSTADGLIAATLFFVVQGVVLVVFKSANEAIGLKQIVLAFGVSGGLTYVLARYTFWRTKTQGVPAIAGPGAGRAAITGLGVGVLAGALGIGYAVAVKTLGLWSEFKVASAVNEQGSVAWIFLLTVLAAPLFEEFIFRGLIFGGMRRSLRAPLAMAASAAIFAIVHPPPSMLPVFVLGLGAAFVYERSKMLLAPMLTHAVYNAMVVGFALYMR
jgi:ABC-2 type transport system permease protein